MADKRIPAFPGLSCLILVVQKPLLVYFMSLINPYEACPFKPNHRRSKTIPTFSKLLKICHVKQNGSRITFNSNLHSRVTFKKKKKIIIINKKICRFHVSIQFLNANHDFKQINLHHTSRIKYKKPSVQGRKRTSSCVDKVISNSYFVGSVNFCHRDATLKAKVCVTRFQIDPF